MARRDERIERLVDKYLEGGKVPVEIDAKTMDVRVEDLQEFTKRTFVLDAEASTKTRF